MSLRIAVDAMGGDYAPHEIVKGAVDAACAFSDISTLFLVGDESAIQKELSKHGTIPKSVTVLHASQVVEMGEAPAVAIRRKKDSSISRAIDLVKDGEADAVFSAGSTGAAVAGATLKLRTLECVERTAIAVVMPTMVKPFVLLDAGATIDCTPKLLTKFAVMGSVYSHEILHRDKPTVGLVSIGGEESKGNDATKEAFRILENSELNFVGNVEGRDLFEGNVDVAVCDGFVGNVVLKISESVAHALGHWMKDEFLRNPMRMLGAFLLRNAFKTLKHRADPAMYGGAPLLGANGICIIGHGSSSARAVYNGIRVAKESVEHRLNHVIIEGIKNIGV